jgi:hypothetical protein
MTFIISYQYIYIDTHTHNASPGKTKTNKIEESTHRWSTGAVSTEPIWINKIYIKKLLKIESYIQNELNMIEKTLLLLKQLTYQTQSNQSTKTS